MKRSQFLKSAAVLSAGGIVAKAIGALYRMLLTGLIGGRGMGLYQMAYPLFCVFLTFSSAGIPAAFSRMVARERTCGRDARRLLSAALALFFGLGLLGSALMLLCAPFMSRLQGEGELLPCYLALAPAVVLVALIATLRGYYQGCGEMAPTAVSEIVEQLTKAAAGLWFALRFPPARAVVLCLMSVTLSEGVALAFLLSAKGRGRAALPRRRGSGSEIFFSALPAMAAAALLPLSQTVDSVLLVRLLGGADAVTLYGLYAGGAMTLISLPATACYGLAAAAVPAVSRAVSRGDGEEARSRSLYALLVTMLLAVPCAAGLLLFAGPIASLLYPALGAGERAALVRLLRLMSVSAATMAGVNSLAACLTGMGEAKRAAMAMAAAVAVKFVLQCVLTPVLSVEGAAIAANVCYLVAFFLDLVYTVRKKRVKKHDNGDRSRNETGRPQSECDRKDAGGGQDARAKYVACRGWFARAWNRLRNA